MSELLSVRACWCVSKGECERVAAAAAGCAGSVNRSGRLSTCEHSGQAAPWHLPADWPINTPISRKYTQICQQEANEKHVVAVDDEQVVPEHMPALDISSPQQKIKTQFVNTENVSPMQLLS